MTYDDICIYSSTKLEKESVLSTIMLFPVECINNFDVILGQCKTFLCLNVFRINTIISGTLFLTITRLLPFKES